MTDPISRKVSQPGAHVVQAREGEPASYRVAVDYRTNTGGGTRYVTVDAASWGEAMTRASDKVRRQRGVVQVDGGSSLGQPLRLAQ